MDRLAEAVRRGIITQDQCDQIQALANAHVPAGRETGFTFSLVHLLWVAGVALVVMALGILAAQIVEDANTLLAVALVYAAGLLALDQVVKARDELRLLSSVLYVGVAICGALAAFALQEIWGGSDYFTVWPRDPDSGVPLIGATRKLMIFLLFSAALPAAVAGSVAAGLLWFRRFLPAWVLVVPAAYVIALEMLNLISRDGGVLNQLETTLIAAGILLAALAWRLDLRSRHNHGFWLNKLALVFLGSWLAYQYGVEARKTLVLVLAILLIFLSVYWRRPLGVPISAGFVVVYIAELFDWWRDPLVVAAFLAVIGGALIYWGVRARMIENRLEALLPPILRQLRPTRRADPVTFGY